MTFIFLFLTHFTLLNKRADIHTREPIFPATQEEPDAQPPPSETGGPRAQTAMNLGELRGVLASRPTQVPACLFLKHC